MMWVRLDERAHMDLLGFIPEFLSEDDPRPAKEQFDTNYVGGWYPMPGAELLPGAVIKYPGDPLMKPLFVTALRDEVILVYAHGFVVILQKDHSFEMARMD